jgi:transposase
MKTCTNCKKQKPESEFSFRNKSKGTKQPSCKECGKKYSKIHYTNNKAKYQAKARISTKAYYTRNKNYVDNYKSSIGCKHCPESESCCLDFHHISDKLDSIANMVGSGLSLDTIKNEISKCIVVCSNCHRKIHAGLIK